MKIISFKSSKVQSSNVLGFLFLSVLELFNPLNLEPASAQQTPYFQGKTIRLIVGYQPATNHDQWSRMYARYMGKYLPAIPTFSCKICRRRLDDRRQSYLQHDQAGRLDARHPRRRAHHGADHGTQGSAIRLVQVRWIGTPYRAGHVLFMRSDAPVKTLDQLRQTNDPPRCSATGVGSTGYDIPRLLDEALGFKFKVISGYPGGADQDLAMERNEVQCRAITTNGFFAREPFITWSKKGFVRIWLQTEKQRHPKAADAPTIFELLDQYKIDDTKRRLVHTYLGLWGFGSMPLVTSPGLPAERLNMLRDAWAKFSPMRNFKKTSPKEIGSPPGVRRGAAKSRQGCGQSAA